MRTSGQVRDRGGFALAMVVFLLFAVAVAGATGFQVVSNEFTLATQNRDSQEALIIARAGLQRFLGETVGVVGDSVSYGIGNGVATVTTRKLYAQDSRNHMYYIRSEGSVADARTPDNPATRTVGAYAWHRIAPIPQKAALWSSGGTLTLSGGVRIYGTDLDGSGSCEGAGTVGGVVVGGNTSPSTPTSYVTGSPVKTSYSNFAAVYDTVGIRWDILTSPNFPVEFEGYSPGYISSDSFPIVRYDGDLDATYTWNGQGVLIVTGTLRFSWLFRWSGIILAGELGPPTGSSWLLSYWPPEVYGMVIAGMDSSNPSFTLGYGNYYYHSCNAYGASEALSYLELVDNTIFEVNG